MSAEIERVRSAVRAAGVERIAHAAGLNKSVVSRFVHGADTRIDAFFRIVDALEWRVEIKPPARRRSNERGSSK